MGALASIRGISTPTILGVCPFLFVGVFGHPSFAEENAADVIAAFGLRESAVTVRDLKGWEKPHKIIVVSDSPARAAWLQEVAKDVTIVGARSHAEEMAQIADADGLIGSCDPDVVNAGTKLRWIQTLAAGVEDCLAISKVRNGDIILTADERPQYQRAHHGADPDLDPPNQRLPG
jgi:hypothetical protein